MESPPSRRDGRLQPVSSNPVGFMSYARFDDEHDDGQLSLFRERLATEVRAQTGQEFVIFQDRADIAWGQNWQQRIEKALDAVTLLLVIITPGFFGSTACRGEVARFLRQEQQLGRADLILPIYYISAKEIDDPRVRQSDEVASVLASRQFADWRALRFELFSSPLVRKAVADLATRLRDTFWHPTLDPTAAAKARPDEQSDSGRATGRTEPPTHVVDAWGNGDFTTVKAAVKAARSGDRILVRPGQYDGGLVIEKPLEILGDGSVDEIVISACGASALYFRASNARVANLTLRQCGGRGDWFGVDIAQGRLDLEGCDISSQSLACIAIRNGADPRLRRNKIHDGRQGGIYVYGGGLGTLEDNDITANTYAGVEIKASGNPTLRRNKIHDGKSAGVYVHDNGLGTLEDNDITANTNAGVVVKTGGNPTLRRNRINRNGNEAVWIYDGGRGVLEDNDLTRNRWGSCKVAFRCKANVIRVRNKE
jgi:F-box protein 11